MSPGVSAGTAYIDVEGNLDPFSRDIKAKADAALKPLHDRIDKLGDSLTAAGKKMSTFVTLPIAAAFGASIKAASDLSESQNKVDVVFGKSAQTIHKFAETAAKDLGQSKRSAEEAAGTFGNLFTSMGLGQQKAAQMSTSLVKLASDLASFNNVSPQEALDALRSGLVGETEPLRRFGINLNDATLKAEAMKLGLISTTKDALDPATKAQAAYSLILSQSSNAQGDFARTADGLANKTRIVKAQFEDAAASIGANLLPLGLKLAQFLGGIAQGFAQLDPTLQATVVGFGLLAAAAGPAMVIVGNGIKAVQGLAAAMTFLATSTNVAAISSVALGGALVGIGTGVAAFFILSKAMGDAEQKIADAGATFVNTAALGTKVTEEQALAAYRNGVALNTNVDALKGATEANRAFAPVVAAAKTELEHLSTTSGVAKERIAQLATEMGINLGKATDEQRSKLAAAIATIAGGVTPTERLGEAAKTLGNEFATGKEKVRAFGEALDAALGVHLSATEASIRLQESMVALNKALAENGTNTDLATEGGRLLSKALVDVVRAAGEEVEAFQRAGQFAADAATQKGELIARLDELKAKFPQLSGPIQGYIDLIKTIPETKNTDITVNVDDTRLKDLEARLAKLGADASAASVEKTKAAGTATASRFALGGYTGEKEMLAWLHPREVILPLDDPKRMEELLAKYVFPSRGDAGAAAVSTGGANFNSAGQAIVDGFIAGVRSKQPAAQTQMAQFADAMSGSMRSAWGISSPSQVSAEMGEYVMLGFLQGFREKFPEVEGQLQQFSGVVEEILRDMVAGREWTRWAETLPDSLSDALEVFGNMIREQIPEALAGGFAEDDARWAGYATNINKATDAVQAFGRAIDSIPWGKIGFGGDNDWSQVSWDEMAAFQQEGTEPGIWNRNRQQFAGGGIVQGRGAEPVIAHAGEGVFTPEQMAALGGGSDRPVQVDVYLDKERVGRAMSRGMRSREMARS